MFSCENYGLIGAHYTHMRMKKNKVVSSQILSLTTLYYQQHKQQRHLPLFNSYIFPKPYPLQMGIKAMDEHLGDMSKLTGSSYSTWKSKLRDMLACKDLWLPVQFGDEKPKF